MEIAKEYTRNKQRRHNAHQAQLNRKIKLRWKAIEALPEEFQEDALKPAGFIPYRPPPTLTPPIPGYTPPETD